MNNVLSKLLNSRSGILAAFFLFSLLATKSPAQTTDSTALYKEQEVVLEDQLTRAVLTWQAGKAKDAYLALDSIIDAPINPINADTKIKAAIWTSTYLQQQYKYNQSRFFIDSALTWAQQYHSGEPLKRAYETLSQWHLATGNAKEAFAANNAALKIKDSLAQLKTQASIDSLTTKISSLQAENDQLKSGDAKENEIITSPMPSQKVWMYVMGLVIAVLTLLLFLMNSSLQRLRSFPPAPSIPTEKRVPPPAPEVKIAPETPAPINEKPGTTSTSTPAQSNASKELTVRISEVELVLINANSLGNYSNGDPKATKSLLLEYNSQLPLIMKSLDKAITESDVDGIINSLGFLKTFLVPFGMETTINWIQEIEDEVQGGAKVSKLLSRVFQIRNHCRRALDETKSILEKSGI